MSAVLYEVKDRVAVITLNASEKMNALSSAMTDGLLAALEQAKADDNVKAIILTGAGRAFCAGGDIRGLYDSYLAGDGMYMTFFREEYALDQLIHDYPKPVLALMDGFVLGGGMGLDFSPIFALILMSLVQMLLMSAVAML